MTRGKPSYETAVPLERTGGSLGTPGAEPSIDAACCVDIILKAIMSQTLFEN